MMMMMTVVAVSVSGRQADTEHSEHTSDSAATRRSSGVSLSLSLSLSVLAVLAAFEDGTFQAGSFPFCYSESPESCADVHRRQSSGKERGGRALVAR